MTLEIPTPELYEAVIIHPKGRTVTVRALPAVGNSDYRGELRSGTKLTATLDFRDNGDVWARIVTCEVNPSTEGYYCALHYRGVRFANWYKKVEHPTGERPPLYFILPDYEINFPRSPRNAPQVHYLDHYTKLTKEWQFAWWGWNRPAGYSDAETKRQFKKYTANNAFITDYKGSDTHADYVNKSNLDRPPMEIKALFCGMNVVTGADDGEWLYPEYMDAFRDPYKEYNGVRYADFTSESHPWFIHQANVIGNDIPNTNTRRVNPFVNFDGRNTGIPVYFPFMGNKQKFTRYPLAWVRKLGADEPIPSPYNPEMR